MTGGKQTLAAPRPMHVRSVALWPEPTARHAPSAKPPAELLSPRQRGRASMLTRMIAEVATTAAARAGCDLGELALIIGSAHGEMATTAALLQQMSVEGGALSPARFQASVHNTAAGLISIATGNAGFSTCLAAGRETACAVLLEAYAWLATGGADALVVLADEALPDFLACEADFPARAAALCLSARGDARDLGCIEWIARSATPVPDAPYDPVAPLLALLDALQPGAAPYSEIALPCELEGSYRMGVRRNEDAP